MGNMQETHVFLRFSFLWGKPFGNHKNVSRNGFFQGKQHLVLKLFHS